MDRTLPCTFYTRLYFSLDWKIIDRRNSFYLAEKSSRWSRVCVFDDEETRRGRGVEVYYIIFFSFLEVEKFARKRFKGEIQLFLPIITIIYTFYYSNKYNYILGDSLYSSISDIPLRISPSKNKTRFAKFFITPPPFPFFTKEPAMADLRSRGMRERERERELETKEKTGYGYKYGYNKGM